MTFTLTMDEAGTDIGLDLDFVQTGAVYAYGQFLITAEEAAAPSTGAPTGAPAGAEDTPSTGAPTGAPSPTASASIVMTGLAAWATIAAVLFM